ncbi:MAG: tRNA lysidine(34) synthetase TilS [Chloroflexota bacterium]|nr:tRNA lysidine(34) synthetase TilS [Chloroflexota bacterium]
MSLLAESVARDARQAGLFDLLAEAPLVVAVSGGADSLALLSILRELRGEIARHTLHVAHLDHGFRGDASAADAQFVAELAEAWGLACTVRRFDVPAYAGSRKLSAEDAARRVRYAFLAGVAQERGGTVAVAHNADDQAETVLMHLLRGSGMGGLAGMRMLSELPVDTVDAALGPLLGEAPAPNVRLFRPLLDTWRAAIEAHCREAGLEPRLDETNLDTAYRRNFLRHKVLPPLEAASPLVKRHLVRLANIASAEDEVLRGLTDREWGRLGVEVERGSRASISREALVGLPVGLARRIVRRMIQEVAGHTKGLDFSQVEAALQVLSGAPGGPNAVDVVGGLRVSRAGGMGVVERRKGRDGEAGAQVPGGLADRPLLSAGCSLSLGVGSTTVLPNGWTVTVVVIEQSSAAPTPGDYLALFDLDALSDGAQLVLRTRGPGDNIQPLGMRGRKKLQDVLVDAKIPREVRAYLPVVALDGTDAEVLWLPGPGGRRSAIAPINEHTRRLLCIEFSPPTEPGQEAEGSA